MIQEAKKISDGIDEQTLWEIYKKTGNIDVRNELVMYYMPVLKKVAFKVYKNNTAIDSIEDLVSEGMIALISAIDRFEIDRDVKFETYVSYRIHGAMLDFINKQSGYVRKVRDIMKELDRAKEFLISELGREPTRAEIADYLEISEKELIEKMNIGHPVCLISLDQNLETDESDTFLRELSTSEEENPINIVEKSGFSSKLVEAIRKLNEEQQLVLSLFYKEDLSIAEIADILNEDPKRVSQLRFQSIKRLRKHLNE